jgi:hypothetical protein
MRRTRGPTRKRRKKCKLYFTTSSSFFVDRNKTMGCASSTPSQQQVMKRDSPASSSSAGMLPPLLVQQQSSTSTTTSPPLVVPQLLAASSSFALGDLGDLLGTQIKQYHVGKLLGEGAQGEVHLVTDDASHRIFAMKVRRVPESSLLLTTPPHRSWSSATCSAAALARASLD